MANWVPKNALADAVYIAGFEYDPTQDIICSRMDALQRNFGYAYGYDKAALLMSAAIDCEPVFFNYNGKVWMIELWKGQYGLETGCEIGVYNRNPNDNAFYYEILDDVVGKRPEDPNPEHSLFYNCASNSEMLLMSFTLYKNGQPLFTRGPEVHWWLTGFKWGVYSDPSELTMQIDISFDSTDMMNAFTDALKAMGYEVTVDNNKVSFTFDKPKTYQPRFADPSALEAINTENKAIVAAYDAFGFPNNDPNQIPENTWVTIEPYVLYYGDFFRRVLDNLIGNLEDWAKSLLGMVDSIFSIDLSTTAEIDNQTETVMMRLTGQGILTYTVPVFGPTVDLGYFKLDPLPIISPNSVGKFYVPDIKNSVGGSEGWVSYDLTDANGTQNIKFSFGCPEFHHNYISISPANSKISFQAKIGSDSDWGPINEVPKSGHPLLIRFIISN